MAGGNSPIANDRPIAAITMVLCAMLIFVSTDAIAKYLTQTLTTQQIVCVRYTSITVLLLPILLRQTSGALRTTKPTLHLIRGLLLMLSSLLFVFSLEDLPLELSTVIGFAAPLYVTALSIPLLGEQVGGRRWMAVVVGFVGVLIILRPGGSDFRWAMLLTLISSFCWALGLIITRMMRGSERPLAILFYSSLVGAVSSLPLALPLWHSPTGFEWLLLIALGVFNAAGQYLIIRAFLMASASLLAPFSYASLLWAVLIGAVVFGTRPDTETVTGTLVLVSAGLYVWHRERVRAGK